MGQIGRTQKVVEHPAESRRTNHIERGLQGYGIFAREDHRQHDMRRIQGRPTGRLSGIYYIIKTVLYFNNNVYDEIFVCGYYQNLYSVRRENV